MWLRKRKKKKLKSIIGFLSANKINMYNRVGEGEKKKKKSKTIYRTSQKNKNNKCFSWVTAVRVLSCAGNHSSPYRPGMPSTAVLISGPAVGAAQVLIGSYSCVFLPPMSTAIRASAFLCVCGGGGSSQWPFIYSVDTESA